MSSSAEASGDVKQRAQVKIIEQPASKSLRFRYQCEGRSAGSIPGANSTPENKTFPTIQVAGYHGKAVVVVSCVTKDFPYKPHPHSIVGKEGCKKGVCTLEINNDKMTCVFSNLGIQCVKKKDIEEALKLREEIRVDPFHTGFGHRNQPQSIDLNAVRLCFQVFLEGAQRGKFTLALKPVVSEPIFDKKAMCDLTICKLSDFTSPVSGGKEIIMLCDKVTKDDVEVFFYQEEEGHVIWEGLGEFTASDVHKQVAISFRTPRYKSLDVEEPINTYVQLRRPSDKECSEPRPFQFLPLDSGSVDAVESSFDSSALFASKRFKPDFQLYTHILAMDAAVLARRMFHAADESQGTDGDGRLNNASVQCNFITDKGSTQSETKEDVVVESAVPALNTSSVTSQPSPNSQECSKEICTHSDPRDATPPPPPPLPEKGVGFAKLKGNLIKNGEGFNYANPRVQRGPGKTVNFDRSSLSTIISESESDPRFSLASSEDLNSRLSAAFSDYSDLTDVRSIAESEVDVNDALSLISSTHTLNDRLSLLSEASDLSDSGQTVIETDVAKSETDSIDTIEKQLEMLESMSVDPDCQTYSSFQMAMRHPIYGWPTRLNMTELSTTDEVVNDLVYDDPSDDQPKFEFISPTVPPRVESMTVPTPPLPPRRFKKFNQPLPEPPVRDLGLKSALQALKQTFKKGKPVGKAESQASAIDLSQENIREIEKTTDIEPPVLAPAQTDVDVSVVSERKACDSYGDPGENLTEAENYALYMTLAPLATASEFDDNETLSLLYADLASAREQNTGAVKVVDKK